MKARKVFGIHRKRVSVTEPDKNKETFQKITHKKFITYDGKTFPLISAKNSVNELKKGCAIKISCALFVTFKVIKI